MLCSVVIPAYQAGKYLEEAILSVRHQADTELEIIVVDDGSTDNTVIIAEKLADSVIQIEHRGAAAARNTGIRQAKGEWILLLDSDDFLAQNSLKALYGVVSRQEDAEAVFSLARDFISPELTEEQKEGLRANPLAYTGVLPGCSLIKKAVFEKIGYFREDLSSGETVDWMMRMRAAGIKTTQIGVVTLQRRLHLTNTGRTSRQAELQNYATILREKRNSTRKNGT